MTFVLYQQPRDKGRFDEQEHDLAAANAKLLATGLP